MVIRPGGLLRGVEGGGVGYLFLAPPGPEPVNKQCSRLCCLDHARIGNHPAPRGRETEILFTNRRSFYHVRDGSLVTATAVRRYRTAPVHAELQTGALRTAHPTPGSTGGRNM